MQCLHLGDYILIQYFSGVENKKFHEHEGVWYI